MTDTPTPPDGDTPDGAPTDHGAPADDIPREAIRAAGGLVQAAARRLDAQGLIDTDEDGTASLSSDAIRTLFDLVTLWLVHTQGDELSDTWKVAHDTGAVFHQALIGVIFGEQDPALATEAYRKTITALRRTAREHRY